MIQAIASINTNIKPVFFFINPIVDKTNITTQLIELQLILCT